MLILEFLGRVESFSSVKAKIILCLNITSEAVCGKRASVLCVFELAVPTPFLSGLFLVYLKRTVQKSFFGNLASL